MGWGYRFVCEQDVIEAGYCHTRAKTDDKTGKVVAIGRHGGQHIDRARQEICFDEASVAAKRVTRFEAFF
jgi:hypothetical protein